MFDRKKLSAISAIIAGGFLISGPVQAFADKKSNEASLADAQIQISGRCTGGHGGGSLVYIKNLLSNQAIRVTYQVGWQPAKGPYIRQERTKSINGGGRIRVGCTVVSNGSSSGYGTTPATYRILGVTRS